MPLHSTSPANDRQPARWRMLNFTWLAFFLTFVVWYNLAPFNTTIARVLKLTKEQSQALLLCNLALTIPARIAVGMLVDRFGPKRVYTGILLLVAFPCLADQADADDKPGADAANQQPADDELPVSRRHDAGE